MHDAVESDVRDIADLEICKLTDVYVGERVQGLAIGEAALAKLQFADTGQNDSKFSAIERCHRSGQFTPGLTIYVAPAKFG